jgi:hypothetical protein
MLDAATGCLVSFGGLSNEHFIRKDKHILET